MKKVILIVSLVFLCAIGVLMIWKIFPVKRFVQKKFADASIEAAFDEQDCPPAPVLTNTYTALYQGKLIDTHMHIPSIPDGPSMNGADAQARPIMGVNTTMTDFVCLMKDENIDKVFAFFPVWEPIINQQLLLVDRTLDTYPDRFVPFIMPPDRDDQPDGYPTVDAKTLSRMLQKYPNLFSGYGEIGLYERVDHGGPKGSLALPPDSERMMEIYPVVQQHSLTVYVHLGAGQKQAFENALDAYPQINFIWHGDQLITGSGSNQNLQNIDDILDRHPNAYYGVDELYGDVWLLRPDIHKDQFFAHFDDTESLLAQDLATWQAFIER